MSGKPRNGPNTWHDIDGGSAFVIPVSLIRHENYSRLSPWGHKLIADLARQFTGFNNGYLCAAWSLMRKCGWKSPVTLRNAILELEHYGLLQCTQQGGRNKPNLYSFTWRRINEKPGKPLDVGSTMEPSNAWKAERPLFIRTTGRRKIAKRRATSCAA